MELKDVSCNWKKLQASLSQESSIPRKRKAAANVLQPRENGVKHRKVTSKSKTLNTSDSGFGSKDQSMGSGWSKATQEKPSASLALWADDNDIPAKDLAAAYGTSLKTTSIPDVKQTEDKINAGLCSTVEVGKFIAIDCEMVGVGPNPDDESALARVSIVNYHGIQVYDSYVLPKESVTDFRTFVSGITPETLKIARTFEVVQTDVARLLDGRILIGHAVKHDLSALMLGHSKRDIRDTSKHPAFKALARGRTPGLKRLARDVLGVDIQGGEHSSIEDARATMLLFRRQKESFDSEHMKHWGPDLKRVEKVADGEVKDGSNKRKKKHKKKKIRK